jgi:hypothetical protein
LPGDIYSAPARLFVPQNIADRWQGSIAKESLTRNHLLAVDRFLHKREKGGILPAKERVAIFLFCSYSILRLISSIEVLRGDKKRY